ncbi:hypothetical protein V8C86DRAFT_3096660 [Haematococcus lacustris]
MLVVVLMVVVVVVVDDLPRGHLASFGLPQELAEKLMYQLSGGQKNRIAFAKMTWIKPHILLLDEYSSTTEEQTVLTASCMERALVVFKSQDLFN